MSRVFLSHSPEETKKIAAQLSEELHGFIALYGRMGVGKTAFAAGFIQARFPNVRVSSPTYTVMNCYSDELYHLDLYRLSGEDDLESVGFYDIDSAATVLCELPQRLPQGIVPDVCITMELDSDGETRIIKVE